MTKSKKAEKSKAVLDTSCCVSALLSNNGASARVFGRIISEKILNFYTDEIMVEIKKVLKRKKFNLSAEKQEQFIHWIEETSFRIQLLEPFKVKICRDSGDDKFLSLANQINANFIITMDNDLPELKNIKQTKIIAPHEFLKG